MPNLERYAHSLEAVEYQALEAWISTFWDFQIPWMLETNDYAICNKSRQIGLSHTTSAVGVLWGAFHGEMTTIISIGDRESVEVLDKAKKHARILAALGSGMAQLTKDTATEIGFASGGRILALPSTGGRSFTGNVFLDEFAYQERASKVWDAAAAVTMLGGKLRVASTPNGVGNDFEQLWGKIVSGTLKRWVSHEIPLETAVASGYPVDMEKCWALAKGDPRLFDQLFNCKFLDGEAQYIPTASVLECSTDDLYTYEGDYFAGLDIGRSADLTVLLVIRKTSEGLAIVQSIETCKRTSSDDIDDMVERAFRKYGIRRLCVDSTGLGIFPAERLQREHGKTRVEPVSFTLQSKEEMATGLYSWLTENMARIPKTDIGLPAIAPGLAAKLRNDICSIRRIVTSSGNVRYDAPHTDEGHADTAWAFALALHAAGKAPGRKHEINPPDDDQ